MSTSHDPQQPQILTPEQLTESRAGNIYAAVAPVTAVATIAVILRIIARRKSRSAFSYDDYLIVLALVFVYGLNILTVLMAALWGLGRHFVTVLPSLVSFQKAGFVVFTLHSTSQGIIKASLLTFYYRLFSVNQRFRWASYISSAIVAAWYFSVLFAGIFQCRPPAAFWNPQIANAHCVNLIGYSIGVGITNLLTDVLVLCLPIPMVWSLRLTSQQKWSLTGIFALGFFVCSMSIVRITYLVKATGQDFTWALVDVVVWTAIEPSIGILSACLPTLRPLFSEFLGLSSPHVTRGTSFRHDINPSGKATTINSVPSSKTAWSPSSEKGAGQGPWKRLDEEGSISYNPLRKGSVAKSLPRAPVSSPEETSGPGLTPESEEPTENIEMGEWVVRRGPAGTIAADGQPVSLPK